MFTKIRLIILAAVLAATPFLIVLAIHADHGIKTAGRTGCC